MPSIIPPAQEHAITLAQAKQQILAYRQAMQQGEPVHPTVNGGIFNIQFIKQLINTTGCEGIRFYFAKVLGEQVQSMQANAAELIPTVVLVAVDGDGNDLITEESPGGILTSAGENSWPCPPHCGTITTFTEIQ